MSPSGAWGKLLRRPPSPSDAPRGAAARRPATSARASTTPATSPARACTATRWLRRGLLAILAAVPLLAALPFEAAAQTTPTANADGSYTVPRDWALKPSAVARGAKFRLMFITSQRRNATSTDIAVYNSFVQARAAAGHMSIRPYSAQFRALGSTAAVDARDNASTTGTGVPIYWLGGAKVADDYADFHDGSWASSEGRDETSIVRSTWTWSGSDDDGTESFESGTLSRALGATLVVAFGTPASGLFSASGSPQLSGALYALSPVFLVDARPAISIASGVSPVTEGTAASFTLTASPAPTADLDVEVDVYELGGVVSASDLGTRTVIIPANQATATFTVSTVNDDIDELPARVHASVLPGTDYTVGSPNIRAVDVNDNDDPVLRLGSASYGVAEGISVRVTLNFRDRALFSATTVGIACTDGTANGYGLDFTCPATVTVPRDARSHTFTIPTQADPWNEGKETFTVAIGSVPSGVRKGTPSSATVTIADPDVARPVVRVTPVSSPVTEGEEARFTVRRDIAGPEALTVALTGQTNGALFDSRLRLSNAPPKVTIPGGHSSIGFAVPTVNDGSDEPDGWVKMWVQDSFSAYLGDYEPHRHGGYNTYVDRYDRTVHYPYDTAGHHAAQVTVLDDEDSAPLSADLHGFSIPGTGLPEGATGRFNLILSRVLETWETVTLPLTLDGTATRGADYTLRCRAAAGLSCRNLASGDASLTIDGAHFRGRSVGLPLLLTAIEDATDEPAESVTLSLGGRAESINIVDAPDAVTIAFTRSESVVRENNNPAQPCMRVTPPSGRDIPLHFTKGGTAIEGRTGDYYFPHPPVLTAGQRVACFDFLVVDNTRDEPDETIVLTLDTARLPSWVTAGDIPVNTFTIVDNEPTAVSLARTGPGTVTEGATVGLTVTLARALVAGEVVGVPLAVSGTGVTTADWNLALAAGADLNTGVALTHAGTATPQLRFEGAGARTATLVLETVNDGLDEGGAETFAVALGPNSRTDLNGFDRRDRGTNVGGGADPHPTHNRFTVTVNDGASSLPELTITGGAAVTEGTAATFTVTASPVPPYRGERDVLLVNIGVADAPGADFLASSLEGDNGFWDFVGGVASRTFTLATVPDETDEPSGPVTVTLRPRAGHYTVGTPASATVTVNDDDTSGPTVSFGGASYSAAEGEAASVTVRISPRRSAPTAVGLTYAHDTATGGDYTAAPASVTIPANAASHTFTVQTTEDTDDESDETFTLAIGTLPTGVVSGDPASTTVTITDDDAAPTPTVRFGGTSYSTAEGAAASVTVRISPTRSAATAVGLTWADVDAEAGDDYTAAPASVTIPANAGSHTFTVQTTEDTADESDETFTLAIGTLPAGVATGSPSSTTVTITDDDDPPPVPVVTIRRDASSVTEGTAAAFTVWASVAPVSDLDVTVEVAEGSGGDFVAAGEEGTQTVTIEAGETSEPLSVPTVDDITDEPGAEVTATVAAGSGYTVGTGAASATVAVADGDPTTVTLTGTTSAIDEAGGTKTLTLTLNRALVAGERLDVPVVVGGVASYLDDYRFGCAGALECRYVGSPGGFVRLVGGPDAVRTATFILTAVDDAGDEGAGETVTVGLGTPGGNLDGGARALGSVEFEITDDDDPLPVVTIAGGAAVTEGGDAVFTLTADRAPSASLEVKVAVEDAPGSDFLAADDEGADTVTLGSGLTSVTYTVPTVNDDVDEPDGPVRVALAAGSGYRRGTVSSATVEVADNDVTVGPTLSIGDKTQVEGTGQRTGFVAAHALMQFTIRLSAPQPHWVRFTATSRDSTPVSARGGQDYIPQRLWGELWPGQTTTHIWVTIIDDSHDEGDETFEVVLSEARGAAIADGLAVGTITNDDPMPAAWLARFGRTVAEAALDGIAGRLAAPRTPGMSGTLAGLTLGGGAPSGDDAGAWPGAGPGLAPGGDGTGVAGPGGLASPPGRLGTGGLGSTPGGFGTDGFGHDAGGLGNGFDEPQSQTLTMRDALLGSRFTLTGPEDGSGGSLAFWGRASHGSFDGREGTFSLDGEATTALLGADYSRGGWLVGLALAQSEGEGDYRDTNTATRAASQVCPDGAGPLCGEAVREGDGTVEASLTAALPYASLEASERLELWGALGYGEGEVTLETAMGGRYGADTTWRMAAAGLRGDLLEAPAEGSGPALALTSDALWARTASEKTRDLAASASDVTRLRLGLEGSWRMALDGGDAGAAPGASLVPRLEVGARHDGGDAETGFGVELGGGLAWTDPALGLTLDVSGRTLLAHEDGDLEDRGFAASLGFDPRPESERGPSFSLRQDFGGQASGGLDALFQPAPLDTGTLDEGSGSERTGAEATSRWTAQIAYGLPAFGGRWTGSPHAGLGLSPDTRDYTLGWRWTPAENAHPLTFGLKATRRESDAAAPEHTLGFEASARW